VGANDQQSEHQTSGMIHVFSGLGQAGVNGLTVDRRIRPKWGRRLYGLVSGQRPPIERPSESRLFVDGVLLDLKREKYRPAAWGRFVVASSIRSLEQIAEHERASVEIVGIFAMLTILRGARVRAAVACLLAITHLGLLGDRRSIGLANAFSLLRAGLPFRRWAVLVAVCTDLADGVVARRAGPTAFGSYADPLADLAFWTAVARRGRIGSLDRLAILSLWTVPAAAIMAGYSVAGRSIDYPRPVIVRRASAIAQALLTFRLILRVDNQEEGFTRLDGRGSFRSATGRRSAART